MRRRPIPLRPRYLCFLPPLVLDALRQWGLQTRRVCAEGLCLCRCWELYGDLRGGFVVAGVSGAGCLLWGVVRRLVASGGVSCGVLCGVSVVVVSWVVLWGVASVGRFVVRVVGRGVCSSCRCGGALGGAGVALCVVSWGGEGG